jgi:hypothetical protein
MSERRVVYLRGQLQEVHGDGDSLGFLGRMLAAVGLEVVSTSSTPAKDVDVRLACRHCSDGFPLGAI